MSRALDPGEAVSEAVHVLKGDQRESLLLVPLWRVTKSKCSVKSNHFIILLYFFVLLAATSSML